MRRPNQLRAAAACSGDAQRPLNVLRKRLARLFASQLNAMVKWFQDRLGIESFSIIVISAIS